MNALVIARRELAEKRFIFFTAIALTLLPIVASFLPILGSVPRQMFLVTVGGIFAIGFTLTLAIMLGVSVVGRDLSEKRLSFYFAKPLASSSIWFGKLLASALLVAGCFVVMITPVALSNRAWDASWNVNLGTLTGLMAGLSIVLFFASHVASTMLRSRSAIIAIDAVLASAAVAIATVLVRRLYLQGAVDLSFRLADGIAAAGVLLAIAGGAWQLERGRADRLRNHIELSKFVWPGVAVIIGVATVFVLWVTRVTPQSLTGDIQTYQAKTGPWTFVQGETKGRHGYQGKYLVNITNGSWYRYRPAGLYSLAVTFSADGRHAAYLEGSQLANDPLRLYTLSLDGTPERTDTGLTTGPHAGAMVLSDDGTRLAYFDEGKVNVVDLPSKRSVGSALLPSGNVGMFFATDDLLRIYSMSADKVDAKHRTTFRILEFDAARHALRETSVAPIVVHTALPKVSADGKTLLLRTHDGTDDSARLLLADARTAEVKATIPLPHRVDVYGATLLDDNRIAYVTGEPNGHGLLHVGGREAAIDLGVLRAAYIVGHPAPGKLVLTTTLDPENVARGFMTLVVDIDRGVVERRQRGAFMVMTSFGRYDPRVAATTTLPEYIVHGGVGLNRWNALTGKLTPLF